MEDADKNQQPYISDEGAPLNNCYKTLMKYNYCDEKHFPYHEENANKFPPENVYNLALSNERV